MRIRGLSCASGVRPVLPILVSERLFLQGMNLLPREITRFFPERVASGGGFTIKRLASLTPPDAESKKPPRSLREALFTDAVKGELVVQATESKLLLQLPLQPVAGAEDVEVLDRGAFGADDVIVMLIAGKRDREKGWLTTYGNPAD